MNPARPTPHRSRTVPGIEVLSVFLNETLVGSITRMPGSGDRTIFTFDENYLNDTERPTLSLSFKGREGDIAYQPRAYSTRIHPFFSNLLPEGKLRDYITERDGVNRDREFFLLRALGKDLPGSVIVRPSEEALSVEDSSPSPPEDGPFQESGQPLKFSLAGVQLKFSAIRDASGGLTIPAYGLGGSWIVKLPSERFEAVPENEYAMMRLAAHAGFPVPEIDLVSISQIQGLPMGLRKDGYAFVIRRFDRDGSGGQKRIHIEDFAQVFGLTPAEKYGKASYGNIAQVVWTELGPEGIRDFIARLVFNAAIGNGDMHMKNWSLVYPDRRAPQLAPAYDFLSTLTYTTKTEDMALSLAKTRNFREVSDDLFLRFADKVGIPPDLVVEAARDAAQRTVDVWNDLRGEMDIPAYMKGAIEEHMRNIPIIQTTIRHMTTYHTNTLSTAPTPPPISPGPGLEI